jgi:hypothetical protein
MDSRFLDAAARAKPPVARSKFPPTGPRWKAVSKHGDARRADRDRPRHAVQDVEAPRRRFVVPATRGRSIGASRRIDHEHVTVSAASPAPVHVASSRSRSPSRTHVTSPASELKSSGVFTRCSAGRPLRSLDVASRVVAAVSADATPRHRKPLRRLCQHSAAVTPAP